MKRSLQDITSVCMAILDKISTDSEHSIYFLDPVDVKRFPEYGLLVQSPMDLGTIKHRLMTDPWYAGERFSKDVRLVFSNALLFNRPKDVVYESANVLLKRFEHEWSKFAADPSPDLLELEQHTHVVRMRVAPSALEEKAGVFRQHTESIVTLCSALAAGKVPKKKTFSWNEVNKLYGDEALMCDAASVVSALEDGSMSGESVAKWLQSAMETTGEKRQVCWAVMALLAADETPVVDALSLALRPPMNKWESMWNMILERVSRYGTSWTIWKCIRSLCQQSDVSRFQQHLEQISNLLDKESLPPQQQQRLMDALLQFASWSVSNARSDLLTSACSRVPLLRSSIVPLACNAVLNAPSAVDATPFIAMCYPSTASASSSSLCLALLKSSAPDRALWVASALLESPSVAPAVLAARIRSLLAECANSSSSSPESLLPLVRVILARLPSLPKNHLVPSLAPTFRLSSAGRSRRALFANTICSVFLSLSLNDFSSIISSILVITRIPNSFPPAIIAPASTAAIAALPKASLQHILSALVSLRLAPPTGWESWSAVRQELLAALTEWSDETRKEALRIDSFEKLAVFPKIQKY